MKVLLKKPALFFLGLSIIISFTSVLGSTPSLIVLLFAVFFIMFKYGVKALERKSVYWFFAFCVIVVLYAAFGRGVLNAGNYRGIIYSFVDLISVFIISYYLKKINTEENAALLIVSLLVLLYSAVGTTMVSYIDPMAIRKYGHSVFMESDLQDISDQMRYRYMGMMSYSLAHAMSAVTTGLSALICYTKNKWVRIISVFLLVLIVRLLFVMTITTAMLLSAIGVTFVFSYKFSKGSVFTTIMLLLLFFVGFFVLGFSSLLLDFAQDNSVLSAKLNDLFYSLETGEGEGQAGYRQELYLTSFRTFLRNPILGWGVDNGSRSVIGEHSFVLDYLAYYGVFALLFFGSLWKEVKTNGLCLNGRIKLCYYFSFVPIVGMFIIKARSVCLGFPFMSLVFLQVVFRYLQREQQEV